MKREKSSKSSPKSTLNQLLVLINLAPESKTQNPVWVFCHPGTLFGPYSKCAPVSQDVGVRKLTDSQRHLKVGIKQLCKSEKTSVYFPRSLLLKRRQRVRGKQRSPDNALQIVVFSCNMLMIGCCRGRTCDGLNGRVLLVAWDKHSGKWIFNFFFLFSQP